MNGLMYFWLGCVIVNGLYEIEMAVALRRKYAEHRVQVYGSMRIYIPIVLYQYTILAPIYAVINLYFTYKRIFRKL